MFKNFVPYEKIMFLASVQDSNWSGTIKILGQFFLLILLVMGILFVTYYFVKMNSKGNMVNRNGRNMEVVETLAVSYQSYIQIVKVCDEYFLLSVNKEGIEFLAKLDDPDIKTSTDDNTNKILDTFEKYLSDFKKKDKDKTKDKDKIN